MFIFFFFIILLSGFCIKYVAGGTVMFRARRRGVWRRHFAPLNRYLSRLPFFIFPQSYVLTDYRVLARGILHILRSGGPSQRRATVQFSCREGCSASAEADFAVKRRFFHGI